MPIVVGFCVANRDALTYQVNVFDAEPHTFHQAQAAAVAELGHQTQFVVRHGREDRLHFLTRENCREASVFHRTRKVEVSNLDLKDLPVEVKDSLEGLVLGRPGNVLLSGKVGQECADFRCAHLTWVSLVVIKDEAQNPVSVRLDSARRATLQAH